ncbi:MAG: HmuY family protein [Gemmatimonadetes bacterium]|nr:HmuY family protein [Gemmatimonadota bacterium]
MDRVRYSKARESTRRPQGSRRELRSTSGKPVWLIGGFALFVLAIGYILVSSLIKRSATTYPFPSAAATPTARGSLVQDTVTIDARASGQWSFFDFESGGVDRDTADWDLAFRRFAVIASGGVADLGEVVFGSVDEAPVTGYRSGINSDSTDAILGSWYSYGLISHLLEPKRRVYAIRTVENRFAKLEFLSYYCTGMVAGCVTFVYVYQRQPGVTNLGIN